MKCTLGCPFNRQYVVIVFSLHYNYMATFCALPSLSQSQLGMIRSFRFWPLALLPSCPTWTLNLVISDIMLLLSLKCKNVLERTNGELIIQSMFWITDGKNNRHWQKTNTGVQYSINYRHIIAYISSKFLITVHWFSCYRRLKLDRPKILW